jgi:hypothetical protein
MLRDIYAERMPPQGADAPVALIQPYDKVGGPRRRRRSYPHARIALENSHSFYEHQHSGFDGWAYAGSLCPEALASRAAHRHLGSNGTERRGPAGRQCFLWESLTDRT